MISRRTLLQTAIGSSALAQPPASVTCDVAIYGATPGGIAAALAAARLGRNVVLLAHEDHIGGIVSNGLTNADIGKRQAVGGIFYEFTRRVVRHYEQVDRSDASKPNVKLCRDGYWYEASLTERLFHDMIRAEGSRIRLLLSHELTRALVANGKLVGAEFNASGRTVPVRAAVFIDATYEGDLAAAAGAPFKTGREGRSEHNERYAGRIYMRFRETEPLAGSTGEGDNATQAYCFRFHVTTDPARRIPIERPKGYRREDYHFVLEDIRSGRAKRFRDIVQVYAMPNGKFELNSDHVNPATGIPAESLDLAEENWEWPTATVARRGQIYQRYLTHNVGLIWLLQNDTEVPEPMRKDALQYGWSRDEWASNGHVPRQVYVRQGRRVLGDYVLTERDADVDPSTQRTRVQPTSIATIEWAFDPHAHHKYDPAHPGVREGYFFVEHEPFQVPYGVLAPRKIDGLLVPVACSCSHVAYNAVRMEPVFMALGEAAGIASHLAIEGNVPVRKVPAPVLQRLLVERGGVITFLHDVPFDHTNFAALQWLGARGWNSGYRAEPDKQLTHAEGWERLARVLRIERRTVPPRPEAADRQLLTTDAVSWLRHAGYRPQPPADHRTPLTCGSFADLVYRTVQ